MCVCVCIYIYVYIYISATFFVCVSECIYIYIYTLTHTQRMWQRSVLIPDQQFLVKHRIV